MRYQDKGQKENQRYLKSMKIKFRDEIYHFMAIEGQPCNFAFGLIYTQI